MYENYGTRTIFELDKQGCSAVSWPAVDVPEQRLEELLPEEYLRGDVPPLPELAEPDLVRHYSILASRNMCVDSHFYPLGSCTMKYNPKRHERWAALPGFSDLHPYQPADSLQGLLALLYELQQMLAALAGLDAVSLHPAAGAQGELTALLIATAYFRSRGEKRRFVLVPDVAHGTNPASAKMAGLEVVQVRSSPEGIADPEIVAQHLSPETAVFMITNPNTLGLFERHIRRLCEMVHAVGALVYLDGANMNAICGIAQPGKFGVDMMHFNTHKTFSTPHGGGGPGAGPVAVTARLAPFLPVPVVVYENGRYRLDDNRPQSIGRVRSFFGNVGVLIRTYCYLRTLGAEGLRRVAQHAVLNANYLMYKVSQVLPIPYNRRCMHEFVASAAKVKAERNISAMDIAKRLLDYGFHAPTVYFPLVVREALMIEPTETESRETLDAFAAALEAIISEDPELLHQAPHRMPISRPDEVRAARQPQLTWGEGSS
ncbi:MAG: aminomethyl-transferring glycine dehydrogenase subunit GcvPB [Thermoguttaceae bacterium]|nr:aminomethyl-transferring glycine dehydrogenase subunit GcvPB [Thermoguttaceae bacterium]MDW8079388.1 aminomethyl-transferring glycine dehydrogenase subunit GcvPB [Thermoguttaceae bacterium]